MIALKQAWIHGWSCCRHCHENEGWELGVEAGQLTSAIGAWSVEHAQQILAARRNFDEQAPTAPEPVRQLVLGDRQPGEGSRSQQ